MWMYIGNIKTVIMKCSEVNLF